MLHACKGVGHGPGVLDDHGLYAVNVLGVGRHRHHSVHECRKDRGFPEGDPMTELKILGGTQDFPKSLPHQVGCLNPTRHSVSEHGAVGESHPQVGVLLSDRDLVFLAQGTTELQYAPILRG